MKVLGNLFRIRVKCPHCDSVHEKSYLGDDALGRFQRKREIAQEAVMDVRENSGIEDAIQKFLDQR